MRTTIFLSLATCSLVTLLAGCGETEHLDRDHDAGEAGAPGDAGTSQGNGGTASTGGSGGSGGAAGMHGGRDPVTNKPLYFEDVTERRGIDFVVEVNEVFEEIEAPLGRVSVENMGQGAAVGDYDNDGDLDIYLVGHVGQANRLYRNDLERGDKYFTDVTPALLADEGLGRVAHFVDLDNDGWLDLLLINDDDASGNYEPSKLFKNDAAGGFVDVTEASGIHPIGYLKGGAAVVDYDGDGLLDVYVTNWNYRPTEGPGPFPGINRLYRNLGNLEFEDMTTEIIGTAANSFSAIFTDFDGDLLPDLYVAVDHGYDNFFSNVDGENFVDIAEQAGVRHWGNDMGIAAADFDDDQDLDLYVTNITHPDRELTDNVFYVNQLTETGELWFNEEAHERGVHDTYWGWGTEFVDVDQDGDLDIVAVTGFDEWNEWVGSYRSLIGTPSVLFLNDGAGQFERRLGAGLDEAQDSRALIAFDYDRDGDQDLLVTNVGQPARLYENVSTGLGNALTVVLAPDAMALGGVVYATVAGVTKRRDVVLGRSYLAGTPSEVHLGLGDAEVVESLRVVWVDGSETALTDVAANQLVRIEP